MNCAAFFAMLILPFGTGSGAGRKTRIRGTFRIDHRGGRTVAASVAVAAFILAPGVARAHSPGAAAASLWIVIGVASAIAVLARRLLVRRWSPTRTAPGLWRLVAVSTAELLLGTALIVVLWEWNAAFFWVLAAAVAATTALIRLALGAGAPSWGHAFVLALVTPAAFTILGVPAVPVLYVLLGG